MQAHPHYDNVVTEINDFFGERLQLLARCGVKSEQVALDVGLGFGKGLEHNLQLLGQWRQFRKWKRPLVLGASRKSFLGRVAGAAAGERLAPSLASACWALEQGAEIIRCHDARETVQAARLIEALKERQTNAEHN
jgi:dihydropteroate synthase